MLTTDNLKEFVKHLEEQHLKARQRAFKYDPNYSPQKIEIDSKTVLKAIKKMELYRVK